MFKKDAVGIRIFCKIYVLFHFIRVRREVYCISEGTAAYNFYECIVQYCNMNYNDMLWRRKMHGF